ncbi:MAG: tripartite tricarboxylate transporter permease [Proteobacteria bacterium]|nr:tripartite tricarboxylate transporter permease [Pseudomonadota bacterium]
MIIEALGNAFTVIFTGTHLLYLIGGVFLGLLIGITPGLGGIAGLSMLLPFLYGMDPVSALAMLVGLVVVIPTSDTFTSVLMGIPGSSASQATVLDGFPLAKQGHAARALGAAFSASLFGGLFGAVILTLIVVIARPIILAFGSAELFMLTVLGLSMVGVLAGKSLLKGISACGIGLVLGSIGGAPATSEYRLYMGFEYLTDGIPLVVVGLGIFAVPEIMDLLRQNSAISKSAELGSGWFDGLRDMIRNKWLCFRCAALGTIIGILPGLGGSVVDWISYGHAVQTTKDKSKFGKGEIRGVLGPESSNNAKEGGGLVPTLLFGIPGSGSMAVFLGGMSLIGLEAGPAMVSADLEITYVIVWSLALANVVGATSCLFLSKWVAKLTTVRYHLLAPFMIMVITFAAFQATRDIGDLVALFCVGALGVLMKRFGWPRPALLIGFVLAAGMETYLYQAIQFDGVGFLAKPGVIIIGVLTVVSVFFSLKFGRVNSEESVAANENEADASSRKPTKLHAQAVFAGIVFLIFVMVLLDAFKHSFLGAVFTGTVASVMIVTSVIVLYKLATGKTDDDANYDLEIDAGYVNNPSISKMRTYAIWFLAYLVGCFVFGYLVTNAVFFMSFLLGEAKVSWKRSGFLTVCATAFLIILAKVMVLEFPEGLIHVASIFDTFLA